MPGRSILLGIASSLARLKKGFIIFRYFTIPVAGCRARVANSAENRGVSRGAAVASPEFSSRLDGRDAEWEEIKRREKRPRDSNKEFFQGILFILFIFSPGRPLTRGVLLGAVSY